MVKFSKELEAQLIPEWKEAFVNYWALKKNVKKIKLLRETKSDADAVLSISEQGFTVLRHPLRYIREKIAHKLLGNNEEAIIQVCGDEDNWYETDLETHFSEDNEVKEFFLRLDEQLNKVNQFYKTKEAEFLERGELLNQQLHVLLDVKAQAVLHDHHSRKVSPVTPDLANSPCSLSSSERENGFLAESRMEEVGELQVRNFSAPATNAIAVLERNGLIMVQREEAATRAKFKGGEKKMQGKAKGGGLRLNIPAIVTATRALSSLTQVLWEDTMNGSRWDGSGRTLYRRKIQRAEKMIRNAYVELYKGLNFLYTYSSLNLVAFRKILKKFDKAAKQQTSATYMKAVKGSHFASSDKATKLLDAVECTFTKHFAGEDRKRAMKFLKPQSRHKDSHATTFLLGLFTGSMATLFTVYAFLARMSAAYLASSQSGYMETVYPVFSMFALISLHVFLYGCNVYAWKRTRINYTFIFDFSPATALRYRDVFLVCTSVMTLVVLAMVVDLILRTNGFSPRNDVAIPGLLLLISTGLLVCPFDVFYRSTRYYFLRAIRNIIFSPFYKVQMVDFFTADQLTSQVPLLRNMEFTACYFLAGGFHTHQTQICTNSKLFKELAYVISFLPYFWRAMQCARRWFDEGDPNHITNLGKYVSAMFAAGARLTYAMQPTPLWLALVVVTSTVATIYQLYWDFVKDWGLLDPRSKNPWLRDDLVLHHKSVYYVAIAINFVLRLAWVEAVMHIHTSTVDHKLLDFVLASLEVIRRGHWNYYRLENEHLNNVGKFRAVKIVPLPFHDMDDD